MPPAVRSFALLLCLTLAGCASAVRRSESAAMLGSNQLRQPAYVEVVVTEEARRKRHFSTQFDVDLLRAAIERKLTARGLLATREPEAPTVRVDVTAVRVRSTLVAVTWGFMAGPDHVHGHVALTDSTGRDLNQFEVMTSYSFGGVVGGGIYDRHEWLYERFSDDIVGALVGDKKVKLVRRGVKPMPLRSLLP